MMIDGCGDQDVMHNGDDDDIDRFRSFENSPLAYARANDEIKMTGD